MLYLCQCLSDFTKLDSVIVAPPLAEACRWRWLSQAPFSYNPDYSRQGENLFEDSTGKPCWVFESDRPLTGFEAAPSIYPNGEAILDLGCQAAWEDFYP